MIILFYDINIKYYSEFSEYKFDQINFNKIFYTNNTLLICNERISSYHRKGINLLCRSIKQNYISYGDLEKNWIYLGKKHNTIPETIF